jgi:tetratricopeptide (TPR) repeat protein
MGTKASPYTYNNMGQAYRELSMVDSAFVYFNKAVELKKDFGQAYYERGKAWLKINSPERACEDWSNSSKYGYGDSSQIMINKYCNGTR